VAVAVIVAVIAHDLPLRLGLLAATLAGMTAAIILERRLRSPAT
jgi:hypothetical protein